MAASSCATCQASNSKEREQVGALAVAGQISWREAARRLELTHHAGLKAHMERHYVPPAEPGNLTEAFLGNDLPKMASELQQQMLLAPPELKPLYAVAIRNLLNLGDTKPSQQNLIAALKGIHEITGMKMEQKLMLEFAQARFGITPSATPALNPAGEDIEDAEIVS